MLDSSGILKRVQSDFLVDRSEKLKVIRDAYSCSRQGKGAYVSIHGLSGTGKTKLVAEFVESIKPDNVVSLKGKFGQFGNNKPYSALLQILEHLTDSVLQEDDDSFQQYKESFISALGENGGVIVSLLPKFSLIIGEQKPPLVIGAVETKNRFYQLVDAIFSVFSSFNKSLVLFFDDLQWADNNSIDMLSHIVHAAWSDNVLIIGSYRKNEIDNNPALVKFNKTIELSDTFSEITLNNFTHEEVIAYINNLFGEGLDDEEKFTKKINDVTKGNPFFLNHYLHKLYTENNLWFDDVKSQWLWRIKTNEASNDADFSIVRDSLKKLSQLELKVLKYGMCLRDYFDLRNLSVALDNKEDEIIVAINKLESLGYINVDSNSYEFSHDGVLQSVKDITDEKWVHVAEYNLGLKLLDVLSVEELEERKLEIVGFLNNSREKVSGDKLEQICRLNIEAFDLAVSNGVYDKAMIFAQNSVAFYEDSKCFCYSGPKTLLYMNLSKAYYLNSQFEQAGIEAQRAFDVAENPVEELAVYSLYKDILISESGDYDQIVSRGIELIRKFEIEIPDNDNDIQILLEQLKSKIDNLLNDINIPDQINKPDITEYGIKELLVLLNDVWEAAYYAGDEDVMQLCILINVDISLNYGNSSASAFGYVVAGMIETLSGRYDRANQLGDLALNLVDKYQDIVMLPKVTNLYCNYTSFYKNPFSYSVTLYEKSSKVGVSNGDYLFGLWATMFEVWSRYLSGQNLNEVMLVVTASESFVKQTNDTKIIYVYELLKDLVSNLIAKKNEKLSNYGDYIEYWQQDNFLPGISWAHILLGQYYCIYDDVDKAYRLLSQEGVVTSPGIIMFPYVQYIFYGAHSALRYCKKYNLTLDDSLIKVEESIDLLAVWAKNSKENFEYQYLLLMAEKESLIGNLWEAYQYYNEAVSSAEKYGNSFSIAYTNEMKANFLLSEKDFTAGGVHLQIAANYYQEWGALNKAALISVGAGVNLSEKKHENESPVYQYITTNDKNVDVDFQSVIAFNQVLLTEFNPEILIKKLLETIISLTSVDKAAVLIKEESNFYLKALIDKKSDYTVRFMSDDISGISNIPVSLIRYVIRSKNMLILDDLIFSDSHYDNAYFESKDIHEVLCIPIVSFGDVKAVAYLESKNSEKIFEDKLVKTVSLLFYQLFTSLNNAQLNESLRQESVKLKDTADQLERSEHRFALSARYSEVGVWEWNVQTNELYWGEMVAPMIGGEVGELETSYENFINAVHPEDRDKVEKAINKCFEGEEYKVEHRVLWKDGTVRWLQEAGDVTRDASGQPVRMLGTVKDISEAKENEEKRLLLEKQLQQTQKMEALGQLTGGIAHDFNNLLGVNSGYAALLKEKLYSYHDEKLNEYVEQIITSASRATSLVSQMLTFSRNHDAESMVVKIQPVVKEAVKMLRSMIPASISINLQIDDDLPSVVSNPVHLNQILMNVCINARDAIGEHGSIDIKVSANKFEESTCLSCYSTFGGEYVKLSISDSGSGISPEVVKKVFDPFFTTKEVGQGTGMGLSMVHGVVHAHNGHITLNSIPGHGTTLNVFFTVSEEIDALPEEINGRKDSNKDKPLNNGRVLVVDDEEGIVSLMQELLSENGYAVNGLTDSKEAMQEISENLDHYDCVITDQTMPVYNGLVLAEKIHSINENFPVIICTGYSEVVNAEKVTEYDSMYYMKKPVSLSDILTLIDQLLQ